jgi:hypothetical protein
MEDNIIIDHPIFIDTFFAQVSQLPKIAAAVFEKCKVMEPPLYTDDVGWTEWPESCEESRVLRWLRCHIN